MSKTVEVRQANCHDTCLDVEGPNNHLANVNPIGETSPQLWRVDCDSCFTCIRAGFRTKEEAREAAMKHVLISAEQYWQHHNNAAI